MIHAHYINISIRFIYYVILKHLINIKHFDDIFINARNKK